MTQLELIFNSFEAPFAKLEPDVVAAAIEDLNCDVGRPAGHRDKREQLNKLPVAVPVGPSALFERVKNEGPETNLFLPWEFHAPELQRRRSRSRSRTRKEKGRSRSRSEPRRPRSH
jgi:hypothetical protein